jgi:hypothetical protein
MKLRNILMVVATMGIMLSSLDRTHVVNYTAGDYYDMETFAHKAAGQNVAYTAGENFTAVWTDGGTTWGFSGGDTDDMVNMMWSNGTYGLDVAMSQDSNPNGDGTTFNLGFGMELMGYDFGFKMDTAEDGPMSLNLRGGLNFWVWDTMTFSYMSGTEGTTDYSSIDIGLYSVKEWGPATGYFGMGITSSDNPGYQSANMGPAADDDAGTIAGWADAVTLLNTSFSVESTLTDWCDLRMGYTKSFNTGPADNEGESVDSFRAGLGFSYGSVQLDVVLATNALDDMFANPMSTISGYSDDQLTQHWTLSYTW